MAKQYRFAEGMSPALELSGANETSSGYLVRTAELMGNFEWRGPGNVLGRVFSAIRVRLEFLRGDRAAALQIRFNVRSTLCSVGYSTGLSYALFDRRPIQLSRKPLTLAEWSPNHRSQFVNVLYSVISHRLPITVGEFDEARTIRMIAHADRLTDWCRPAP